MLDTLDIADKLRDYGFTQEQAKGMARVLNGQVADKLATKQDLKDVQQTLTIRMGAMLAVAVAALATLEKLLT